MKALNSVAQPIGGITTTRLNVGKWEGQCDFRVVAMDNFDMILRIDFFVKAQVAVLPYMGGIVVSNASNPKFVHCTLVGKEPMGSEGVNQFILALQLKAGVKKGEQNYVAALVEIKLDQVMEVPDQIGEVLEDFANVMPP